MVMVVPPLTAKSKGCEVELGAVVSVPVEYVNVLLAISVNVAVTLTVSVTEAVITKYIFILYIAFEAGVV